MNSEANSPDQEKLDRKPEEWPDAVLKLAVDHIYDDRLENLKDLRAELCEEVDQWGWAGPEVPREKAEDRLQGMLSLAQMLVEPLPDPRELVKEITDTEGRRL